MRDSQAEAMRLHRLLDETLDRGVGWSEDERIDMLARVLGDELEHLSPELRPEVVRALDALVPQERSAAAVADPEALRALEDEVARLKTALADARATPVSPPSSGTDGVAIAAAILGSESRARAAMAAPGGEARLVELVGRLAGFVAQLGGAYLSATADGDKTSARSVEDVLRAVVAGHSGMDELGRVLDSIFLQIGDQITAFHRACDEGVKSLLKKIDPVAIELDAAKEGGRFGFGRDRLQWEAFSRRYEELRMEGDVYTQYFDGPYRYHLYQLSHGGGRRSKP